MTYLRYRSSETNLKNILYEVLSKVELHDSFTLLSLSQETMDWWISYKKAEEKKILKMDRQRERRVELKKIKKSVGTKLTDFLDELEPEEKKLMEKNYQIRMLSEYK